MLLYLYRFRICIFDISLAYAYSECLFGANFSLHIGHRLDASFGLTYMTGKPLSLALYSM